MTNNFNFFVTLPYSLLKIISSYRYTLRVYLNSKANLSNSNGASSTRKRFIGHSLR